MPHRVDDLEIGSIIAALKKAMRLGDTKIMKLQRQARVGNGRAGSRKPASKRAARSRVSPARI